MSEAIDTLGRACSEQGFRLNARVPARPGVDDDLVIADGLHAALDEIARLEREVYRWRGAWRAAIKANVVLLRQRENEAEIDSPSR